MSAFDETLRQISSGVLTVGESEAHRNMSSVHISLAQAAFTPLDVVVRFLEQARAAYARLRGEEHRGQALWFYAWVDEQAAQLRSTVSSVAELPFGATIQVVSSPTLIARQFLDCRYLDGIPWSEFVEADPDGADAPEVDEPPLNVYVVSI